ncbi:inositol monophosphatase family protein [Denitrobaculum tricleocarpae]|uniref:Inositol-1-monophosphatase n=1 Tax=Denitrobaculum tricleocarpae TaxID=2591009 RepID=A0A545T3Z7_9PROT|nr:inositol monophosphatase family protein [Denitrobaculum tricleocarpae]TQV71947.1 inositol monophosphatase [Denitrobaculum tricleocarpae]
MTRNSNERRLEVACEVARQAGKHALSYFADRSRLNIEGKGVQDMFSQADVETEVLIREQLAAAFPDDGFFGEETEPSGLESSNGTWVVDPIDGTACFVVGIPTWCVSIAFVRNKRIEIGVIYDPNSDELFSASHGQGSFLNGQAIAVAKAQDFTGGMTGFSFSHRATPQSITGVLERLLSQGGMFYRNGSGALTLAYVACGRLNAFFEPHMNSWDSSAGVLLIREAGGWANETLEGDGLVKGALVMAAADGLAGSLKKLILGDETSS